MRAELERQRARLLAAHRRKHVLEQERRQVDDEIAEATAIVESLEWALSQQDTGDANDGG